MENSTKKEYKQVQIDKSTFDKLDYLYQTQGISKKKAIDISLDNTYFDKKKK